LVGFDRPSQPLISQKPYELVLYWQALTDISTDYVVSISLLDKANDEIAYWLNQPTRGIYPASNWRKGELIRDPWSIDLAQVAPGEYSLQLSLFDSTTEKEMGQVALGKIEVTDRERLFELPAVQYPLEARLGSSILLLGCNINQQSLTGANRLTVKLFWQAKQPIEKDYTVFVQLLDPNNTVVGQHDGLPVDNTLPTTDWEMGEVVPDQHQFDFPVSQPGEYRLIAGMYDSDTGVRLPVFDEAGDFVLLYNFTIE
jgi:hypothetical protein